MNGGEREEATTLELLQAIDSRSDVSQRGLARELGVALGLTNLYIKRCVRKGLVKVKKVPANRYFYYLTPKGFSEKGRLTAKYLAISFNLHRRASLSCARALEQWPRSHDGSRGRLLLCGRSELAEIAWLRAYEAGLTVIGTYDSKGDGATFLGFPVWSSWEQVPEFDVCMITTLDDPGGLHAKLTVRVPKRAILVPDVLGIDVSLVRANGEELGT